MIIDPRLTDLLEEFGPSPWRGTVWRHVFGTRDSLEPSWRPGRWSPGSIFAILYTSISRDGALAEADHLVSQYSIPPSVRRIVTSIDVELEKVVDLTVDNRLVRLGVDLTSDTVEAGRCPEIGAAANLVEYQAILAPSARYSGSNLMIFTERMTDGCTLEVTASEVITRTP